MNIYKRNLEKWGTEHQIKKAIEEINELKDELDLALQGRANRGCILSEMADVFNMMFQLMLIFGIRFWEMRAVRRQKMRIVLGEESKNECS